LKHNLELFNKHQTYLRVSTKDLFNPRSCKGPTLIKKIQPPLMIDDQENEEAGPLVTNNIIYFDDPS